MLENNIFIYSAHIDANGLHVADIGSIIDSVTIFIMRFFSKIVYIYMEICMKETFYGPINFICIFGSFFSKSCANIHSY